MKLFRVVYLLFAAIIVLSGCQSNTDNEKNEAKQESKEKVEYKRIISLIPSNTEILY